MSNSKDSFATIDPAALETVTGGRRSATSSSANDDRIMDALNGLENAIRDLGRNNNQPDPMSQMLPLLMLSMMNQPAAAPAPAPVVCQGGRGKKGW